VRSLGISNIYDLRQLEELYFFAKIKPQVVQNRFYERTGFDQGIRAFCQAHGVDYQSFWTLTANRLALQHPWFRRVSQEHGLTAAQALFKFVLQLGINPLTGTTDATHMKEGLAVLAAPLLDEAQMDIIGCVIRGIA
jgi:diketogulonate reductase-like aldo/keto reductase